MQLRWKLILPMAAVVALLLGLLAYGVPADAFGGAGVFLLTLALVLSVAALAVAVTVARGPIAAMEQAAAALPGVRAGLDEARAALSRESAARRETEEALHEAEERYALAVRGANDGLWEWDLRREEVHYSPLWKSLLGYEETEIGSRIDEWRDRIHPDDRERVLQELEEHLAGKSLRFENQHRLRHKDGGWRWILARGTAIRHASGAPYRVVGLHTDITARRAAEQTIIEVAESLSSVSGDECLRTLVRSFAQVLGVREAFVCEPCDSPPTRARMLAWWRDGEFLNGIEYDLEGTPCKNPHVFGRTCYCPIDLEKQWPLEKQFNRRAYLGLPIHDSAGRLIGHIACTDNRPMPEQTPHLAIFKLFAQRGAIELERRALERMASSAVV
ncbi:MAG: PAS domain-containing protein [Burkholderiales bacterium]|nr:PAS domain-containing protein [Burkholderiales bacterium]